ncbi:hypothetical protein FIBSPDRAFT_662159, partial [Athelia psychrophila]
SPLPDLVDTNYARSPSQEQLDQDALGKTKFDMSHINNKIARVQAVLKELLHAQKALQDYREEHRPLLSPIHHLPSKMLGDIFLHSLPDDWKHNINHYRCTVMLPGQVCRRWREVVTTMSTMWSL